MQLGTYLLLKCGNVSKEHKYLQSDNLFYMEHKWNVKKSLTH